MQRAVVVPAHDDRRGEADRRERLGAEHHPHERHLVRHAQRAGKVQHDVDQHGRHSVFCKQRGAGRIDAQDVGVLRHIDAKAALARMK